MISIGKNYIINRIKKYRKIKKMSQEELAKIIGVHRQTIFKWENEKRTPNLEAIIKMANAFDISPSKLIDPIPLKEAREQANLTPEELAEKVGVSLDTYIKWENYLEIPPPEMKKKLEEVLEENLDFSVHIQKDRTTIGITGNTFSRLKEMGLIEEGKEGNYQVVESLEKTKEWTKEKRESVEKIQSNAEYLTSNMIKVPVINYHAGAGKPFVMADIEVYIEDYIYLPKGFVPSGKLFAIRVQGDSMTPKFKEGDYAVVYVDGDVLSGNIAVVQIDAEDLLLKQVFWLEGRKKIELRSFNPAYKPLVYDTKDIFFIGKVVGKWENIF